MECITCTACIDACDSIMEKLNRPKGLIRYDSVSGLKGERPRRIRKYVYGALMLLMVVGLAVAVVNRQDLMINVLRSANTPYKVATIDNQEMVINQFKIHFKNQTFHDTNLSFRLPENLAEKGVSLLSKKQDVAIEGGEDFTYFMVLSFPKKLVAQDGVLNLDLHIHSDGKKKSEYIKRVKLVGPRSIKSK